VTIGNKLVKGIFSDRFFWRSVDVRDFFGAMFTIILSLQWPTAVCVNIIFTMTMFSVNVIFTMAAFEVNIFTMAVCNINIIYTRVTCNVNFIFTMAMCAIV